MSVIRLSAVEIFGIPIEGVKIQDGAQEMSRLMLSYDIEPEVVTDPGPTDITPFYFTSNSFRYYLSLIDRDTAHIELMPEFDRSETYKVGGDKLVPGSRTIVLPTDQEMMVIVGGSPRYPGLFCLHELIASIPV